MGAVSSAIIAAIASVLYGVAYYTSYDTEIRHFDSGSVLPVIFGVLLFLSFVIFTVTAVLLRKKYVIEDKDMSSAETFALWFSAVMFAVFGIMSLASGDGVALTSKLGETCSKVTSPLALLSAVALFLSASDNLRGSTAHRIFSFAPILWALSLLFRYYFDLSHMPLNDPELALTMVSVSGVIVFLLSECRSALGINTPAGAVFGASAALCMTGAVSAARVVLVIAAGHTVPSPMESIMFLTVALLAGTRLCALRGSFAQAPCEAVPEEETNNEKGKVTDDEKTDE